PLRNLRGSHSFANHRPVGHICGPDPIRCLVVPLQSLRHDHGAVRQSRGSEFSEAEGERGKTPPLFSLPILSLNRDHGLLSYQAWKERKQRRTLGMVVHDVATTKHYVDRAEPSMHERLQVL